MAQTLKPYRNHDVFEGDAAADGEVVILIEDADKYENFVLYAITGQVTVQINNYDDDSNWSNDVALQDMAGTTIDQATIATNLNAFGLVVRTTRLRVVANSAAAAAAISCWNTGVR